MLYTPPGTVISLPFDYTNNVYPPSIGERYIYHFIGDLTKSPIARMRVGLDEFKATPFPPPVALTPTGVNPATNFTARWTLPTGITQALLFVFLDANGKIRHPEFASGALVTGTTRLVEVPIQGQTVSYSLVSMKDGVPVSLDGNRVLVVAAGDFGSKATGLGYTYRKLNDQTWVGTVTKGQPTLRTGSNDLSVQTGGGDDHWKEDFTEYVLHTMPDGHSVEWGICYRLTAAGGGQRFAAMSHKTNSSSLQLTASDTSPSTEGRMWMRNTGGNTIASVLFPDYRDLNTHIMHCKITRVGANWEIKTFGREAGSPAALLNTTTVAISTQTCSIDLIAAAAWVRATVSGWATGRFQDVWWKNGGTPNSDVSILDLIDTGALSTS